MNKIVENCVTFFKQFFHHKPSMNYAILVLFSNFIVFKASPIFTVTSFTFQLIPNVESIDYWDLTTNKNEDLAIVQIDTVFCQKKKTFQILQKLCKYILLFTINPENPMSKYCRICLTSFRLCLFNLRMIVLLVKIYCFLMYCYLCIFY